MGSSALSSAALARVPADHPPEDSVPAATVAAKPLRLRHVDSLRAVSALLVIWTHFAPVLQPLSADGPSFLRFLVTLPPTLNFGRVGVTVFFAISGFVICRSFGGPREGSARRFLIRRFCRLYPAFWASMVGGVLIGLLMDWPLTPGRLAANATMLPGLFGQPDLLGVYWTLAVELLFYALCLGLHLAKGLDSLRTLGALSLAAAVLPRAVHKAFLLGKYPHFHLSDVAISWSVCLAVMFWGAAFRLVYEQTGGFRQQPWRCRGTWFLVLAVPLVADLFYPDLKHMLVDGRVHLFLREAAFVPAMVIFALWIAVLRVEWPPLTYLGVISYSLYLFHPVVMDLARLGVQRAQTVGWLVALPLWVLLAGSFALTVALCALTYRWVEQPAIALGKRWAGAPLRPLSLALSS